MVAKVWIGTSGWVYKHWVAPVGSFYPPKLPGPEQLAFELRHPSWLVPEVYALLERAGAALCLPVGWGIPVDPRLTADWSYVRMHGGEPGPCFRDDELAPWAERIRGYLVQGADSYVYFNNDTQGCAVRDARRLRALLEG